MTFKHLLGSAIICITLLSSCSVSKCRYSSGWRLEAGGRGYREPRTESVYVKKRSSKSVLRQAQMPQDTAHQKGMAESPETAGLEQVQILKGSVVFSDTSKNKALKQKRQGRGPFIAGQGRRKVQQPALLNRTGELEFSESNAFARKHARAFSKADEGYFDFLIELLGALLLAAVLSTLLGGLLFYLLLVLLEGTLALDIILIVLALVGVFLM